MFKRTLTLASASLIALTLPVMAQTQDPTLDPIEPQETTYEEPVTQEPAQEATEDANWEPTANETPMNEDLAATENQQTDMSDETSEAQLADAELDGEENELPRTASPLPLALLIGGLSAGTALGLRRSRRK